MSKRVNARDWTEDISSLLPALTLLQQLGYSYLTPNEALSLRGGKRSNIVLEYVLSEQLQKLNRFEYKGKTHSFSSANFQAAVSAISDFPYDALYTTSQEMYDLLTLGKSFEETIDGDKRSFDIRYIDWDNPKNNVYHVTDEFEIERRNSTATRRPDIVLFVNGIPLVVIEAKRPDLKDAIDQAISQHLRNHKPENVPHFFCLAQLLLAVSQNDAKYGTTATDKEFWAVWKEEDRNASEQALRALVNESLTDDEKDKMLSWRQGWQQQTIKDIWASGARLVSEQDRALYGLTRPERLLDLIFGFIVFDAGVKKIARYQQFFAVNKTLDRVKEMSLEGTRRGGVIWHTTGSGKSLTMVMLAKALALEKSVQNPKIILVNDRIDLDKQLQTTFKNCGAEVVRAKSGKHLVELVNLPKAEIITTVINKFEKVASEKVKNPSADIFVLVDESHRSQYGQTHAKMKNVFPNACYIGFTGTPLLKKEKSTAQKFGGFIHSYPMPKAVADGAVVPLLYEGRDSEFRNTEAVDKWFERITRDLTDEQRADLKRKFKSAEPLYESEARMMEIAYDIGEHFKENFKGTPFKGQLATSSKRAAITYKKLLDELGVVKAEVIVSAPDTREGHDSVDDTGSDEINRFWGDMMAKYGTPEKYQETLIESFKTGSKPEILIVVDKLLTGFDAPRNTVLYVDKRLKEHSILQAVARVNRVFEGKQYGLVIDYRGIFGEMNEALDMYAALEREGYDLEDVTGTLINVQEEIAKLPTRHASLWDVFKEVENQQDTEAMQQWLYLEDRRDAFYEALKLYAKTLQIALSNPRWQEDTPEKDKRRYTGDLKYFLNLRTAVKQRYGETVDFGNYESQIKNMVLKQLGAGEVETLIEPVDIFQVDRFEEELEGVEGDAAKADVIASRVKKVITERMDEDPVYYRKLSELIDEAIRDHRDKRLSDADYLKRLRETLQDVQGGGQNDLPEGIRNRDEARAYYNVLSDNFGNGEAHPDFFIQLAIGIESIVNMHKIRDWHDNHDIKKRMLIDIDDLTYDLMKQHSVEMRVVEFDEPLKKIMDIAVHRDKHG